MDDLKHRLRTASFIAFDDGGNDYTTAQDALAAIEALEAQVAAAHALAAWAKAISERKASPATGGRLVLERDLVGLETARARLFRLMDDLEWAYPEAMAEVNAMHPGESGEQSE